MVKKYRPPNGSHGMFFESLWCDKCWHDEIDFDTGEYIRQCDIHDRAILLELDHPEYPDEWRICPATKKPVCTAFTETEPAEDREPSDPNQLTFA